MVSQPSECCSAHGRVSTKTTIAGGSEKGLARKKLVRSRVACAAGDWRAYVAVVMGPSLCPQRR
jgi:hypothetical protein